MKVLKLSIFSVFFLLFIGLTNNFAADLFRSENQYLTTHWTTYNGLPQNSINSIIQTRDGYLWMATFGGLARFDGVKFTVFNPTNTPELKDNRIVWLYEDFEGILWLTTQYNKLYFYKDGAFCEFKQDGEEFYRFITRNQNGNIWVNTAGGFKELGFGKDEKSGQILADIPIQNKDFKAVSEVLFLADKKIRFINLNNELVGVDTQNSKNQEVENLPANTAFLHLADARNDGDFWLISHKSIGIVKDNKYESLYLSETNGEFSNSAVFVDNEKNLWCLTNKHLYKIRGSNVEKMDFHDFSHINLRSLSIDNEGNFWVGTTGNGLFRVKKKQVKTYARLSDKTPLGANAVIEDSAGNIWVGTRGLLKIKDDEISLAWESQNINNWVSSINLDRNNNLWFAVSNGFYSLANGEPRFYNDPQFPKSLEGINALFFDKSNTLWIGRIGGLQSFQDGKFKTYTVKDGLVNDWVLYITQTRNSDLWIGTTGGLSRFRDGEFTNFTTEDGLTNNDVRDIFEDADGTIWIGTYGGGIIRYRDGKFVAITSKNGLPEDIASGILLDDYDNFWILGNRGIYSFSRRLINDFADGKANSVVCSVYDTADGLLTAEGNGINQYSVWKANDGTLWFTMVQGVVAIDPKSQSKTPPKVYIEDIFIENNAVRKTDRLNLQYSQIDVEINYTGLSFTKPENIQFRYKLEGFDKDWNFAGKRRTAYYSYLPPGEYTFRVEAVSADGVWSENSASLPVIVKAPFWRTWWFFLALFLFIFLVTAMVFQFRLRRIHTARLRQRHFSKQLINAHEAERKRIASELHDGLGQDLLVIKNWALIALKNLEKPQEIQKNLEGISNFASSALEETRTIAGNLMPLHLKRFGLTETIKNMIIRLNKATDIKISFEIDRIDDLLSEKNELSLFRIIQESLNNIVKHSETSAAAVLIKHSEDIIRITIQDYGKGFDVKQYYSSGHKDGGIGLNNIIERVNLIDGEIDIQSKPGAGTLIEIELKV